MNRRSCLFSSLALIGLLHLPVFAGAQNTKDENPRALPKIIVQPAPSFKHLDGQLLVFVANGVGGSTLVSDNLLELNGEKHLGLRIQMVPWCRHNSLFMDLTDQEAQLNAAARIACSVSAIRKDCPSARIFFVGHSAGARVVLAAAEMLPPQSVDRIIVLAPAVSYTYDLTTALKTSRYGIDNFFSSEDSVLDSENRNYRNADGPKTHAAGRAGFHLVSYEKQDIDLYRNLRQYRWTAEFNGNGGHYAWALLLNMRKVMPPLFLTTPVYFAPEVEIHKMPTAK
jgi:pimeloyl-ACP methyl ester carboxylesterase